MQSTDTLIGDLADSMDTYLHDHGDELLLELEDSKTEAEQFFNQEGEAIQQSAADTMSTLASDGISVASLAAEGNYIFV